MTVLQWAVIAPTERCLKGKTTHNIHFLAYYDARGTFSPFFHRKATVVVTHILTTYTVHREKLGKHAYLRFGALFVLASVHEHVVLSTMAVQVDVHGYITQLALREHEVLQVEHSRVECLDGQLPLAVQVHAREVAAVVACSV